MTNKNQSSTGRREFARRSLGLTLGASALAGLAPLHVLGAARPKVVVIGGGPGGGTVARYLAKSGKVDVTLVEANARYTTCFYSNLYLGGFRSFESITHSYDTLSSEFGVKVVTQWATGVDPNARKVTLGNGEQLEYDRLVVAPGIDFKYELIEGFDSVAAATMPHAYKAGSQTRLLKAQLEAMPDGGTFVIAPPPNPFRCPPGPYERASMAAHYFSKAKPKSKILILDAKNKHSKQGLFQAGWERFYPGMIEWLPADMTDGGVTAVDGKAMQVMTADEAFDADVANIIPAQRAGNIAALAGLTDASGWCPVNPATLESRQVPGVHAVGDAIIPGDMPKSGFSANSQAKVCANALLAELTDARAFKPRFRNTCWSLVATDHGIKVGASYEATEEKIAKTEGFISQGDEDDATRAATYREANGWYDGITKDIFG